MLFPHDDQPLFPRNENQPRPTTPSGDVPARLRGLLRHLNGATKGVRNDRLHWVSCRVGDMIANGELDDPQAAADALTDIALAIGLTASETAGTIRSGFRSAGVAA
jgi:hypothetical protein